MVVEAHCGVVGSSNTNKMNVAQSRKREFSEKKPSDRALAFPETDNPAPALH